MKINPVLVDVISCCCRKVVLGDTYSFQATFLLFLETLRVNNKEQEDVIDFFYQPFKLFYVNNLKPFFILTVSRIQFIP